MKIDPKLIDAGTLALMVCLYGDDLGRAATGDAYDDEERWHREQVTDILTAVVPLILATRSQRAAELHELLMDKVGDYEQATIQMTTTATDLTAGSDLVAERTTRQRQIRDEIARLSGELRDLTKTA